MKGQRDKIRKMRKRKLKVKKKENDENKVLAVS